MQASWLAVGVCKRDGNDNDTDCQNCDNIVNDSNSVTGRRLGDQTNADIMDLLQDPDQDVLLFYPSENALSLMDGLKKIHRRRFPSPKSVTNQGKSSDDDTKDPHRNIVILLFLDATWKYAQEMDKACTENGVYPPHMIRVRLTPSTDFSAIRDRNDGRNDGTLFQPRRFDIRAPPTPDHLCTAECIAWVLSIIERDMQIYHTLMKPLDLMVQKWRSFAQGKGDGNRDRRCKPKSEESVPVSGKSKE